MLRLGRLSLHQAHEHVWLLFDLQVGCQYLGCHVKKRENGMNCPRTRTVLIKKDKQLTENVQVAVLAVHFKGAAACHLLHPLEDHCHFVVVRQFRDPSGLLDSLQINEI